MSDQRELTPAYSLYLDALRFVAAAAVYINHIVKFPFLPAAQDAPSIWSLLEAYGAPAVTIFFVLSGFVIAYVVDTRERDARSYTISRVSRLYSVVAPAVLLTLVLDVWGAYIDPTLYAHRVVSPKPMTAEGYIVSFFLVNEFQILGFHGIAPGSNGPWWSLSFEAAYYLLAGVVLFTRPRFAIPIAALLLLAVGKTIAVLLPLWVLGLLLYRYREPLARALRWPAFWWGLSTVAILAVPHLVPPSPGMNFGIHFPWARAELNRNVAQDYAVGLAFAVHMVASYKLFAGTWEAPAGVARTLRFLGAMTFPLYAMHRPMMFFLVAVSPWPASSAATMVLTTLAVAAGVAVMTPVCDWLKDVLRSGLKRALPPPRLRSS